MTIAVCNKEPVRFTPRHYGEAEDAPVYILEVPRESKRRKLREQLHKMGYRVVSDAQCLHFLRLGVQETIAEEDQGEWLEAIDAAEDALLNNVPWEDEFLRARYETICIEIGNTYTPYRTLYAAAQSLNEIYPELATRMFLKGVENSDVQLEFDGDLLSLSSYDALPRLDVIELNLELTRLQQLSRDVKKNSPLPSQSPPTQTNLTQE